MLPAGVTVTEAQGINVLKKIRENLEAQGLTLEDVVTMRVFLDNAPGTDRADYAGWNRAYRQFLRQHEPRDRRHRAGADGDGGTSRPDRAEQRASHPFRARGRQLAGRGMVVEVEVDAVYPDGEEPS